MKSRKQLKDLLVGVTIEATTGDIANLSIDAINIDSREVTTDALFVAIKGTLTDGHLYIDKAIEAGAVVVVYEKGNTITFQKDITYIEVSNSPDALGVLAKNFYEDPSSKLQLVGVTGTNGKTSISTLLYNLFTRLGYKTGLISTIKVILGDKEFEANQTTTDVITLNKYLREMHNQGVTHCFMEVSSHGIDQKRISQITFAGGIFTNLTHDHLDYHKTFSNYRDAKKAFFDQLPKKAFALTNIDDKNGAFMLQNTKAKKYSYASKTLADFSFQILESSFKSTLLKINEQEIWSPLVGAFNAYNLVAAYAAAVLLNEETIEVLTKLSASPRVTGRFEHFTSPKGVHAVVDYAHTPDALKNVLQTTLDVISKKQEIITLIGCGGDRDRTKRPIMAKIAVSLSHKTILTSDNPRSEEPEAILKDMQTDLTEQEKNKTLVITDREEAIKMAAQLAKPDDVILIAGKGHETYQLIKGKKFLFNDMKKIQYYLKSV